MILTRPDQSEKVHYNTVGYPVYIRRGVLSDYPNYSAVSHWHDDVEFIAVVSGHMMYNINGELSDWRRGTGYLSMPGSCTTVFPMIGANAFLSAFCCTRCSCVLRTIWSRSTLYPCCSMRTSPIICCITMLRGSGIY